MDQYYPWVFTLAQTVTAPVLICEAVLAETAFHSRDSALVLRMLETGLARVVPPEDFYRKKVARP
jgi:hypothetical protein